MTSIPGPTSAPQAAGAIALPDGDSGVYAFDHDHGVSARGLSELLGGKGAGLAEMTAALGINVPAGFTISIPVCVAYREHGWPTGLDAALERHVERLNERMGRHFGDPDDPLLLAVRSGAANSMPGMLDTVLNLGINDETVEGLAQVSGDERFAWDTFRRFLTMYAATVMGAAPSRLEIGPAAETPDGLRAQVTELKARIQEVTGRSVPHDPRVQLREAVEAVFGSWDSERAKVYRAKEGLEDATGTAVNVQAMVFGNRGPNSGTGVVFTRDPSTGEPKPYGDYLPRAQGEDVVAGTARTTPITHMGEHQPEVYSELLQVLRSLEIHYRDICDVEFTVEEGRLWLLQTRVGKRGAVAAVRIAVDLVEDPDIRLDPAEAVERVPPELRDRARHEVLARVTHGVAEDDLIGSGLAASPGRASGAMARTSEQALSADGPVILVRKETSPEDVMGMSASVGILTSRGGLVSHAAVVAREWGLPAVVGAHDFEFEEDHIRSADGVVVRVGETITIDGSTGQVWRGDVPEADADVEGALEESLPQLSLLETWAQPHPQAQEENTMKVVVDRDKCTSLGICESLAPEFFEVDDDGDLVVLNDQVLADRLELLKQVVAGCPTSAISLKKA